MTAQADLIASPASASRGGAQCDPDYGAEPDCGSHSMKLLTPDLRLQGDLSDDQLTLLVDHYIKYTTAGYAETSKRNVHYILLDFMRYLNCSELQLPTSSTPALAPLFAMHSGADPNSLPRLQLKELQQAYRGLLMLYIADLATRKTRMTCYRNSGDQPPSVSRVTVSRYASVIRQYFAYLDDRFGLPSPARNVKVPRPETAIRRCKRNQRLTDEQVRQLLDLVDKYPMTSTGRRDRAIIYLLLYSGRRTIELSRADIGDLDIQGEHRVLWYQGKGHDSKNQFSVLHPAADNALEDYLETRLSMSVDQPMLISESDRSSGKRLATRSISHVVKCALKGIGLDDANVYTAHGLRRTFTSHLCDLDVPDHEIADARGDSNLAMIRIYRQTMKRLADPAELKIDYSRNVMRN